MQQEWREAAIVSLWIVPMAIAASVLGLSFLITLESSRLALVGYLGYVGIPMLIGFAMFGFALRRRPRAARVLHACAIRPIALYVFVAAVGLWLWWGVHLPGSELVAPLAIAPLAASLAGLCAIVWRARPRRVA